MQNNAEQTFDPKVMINALERSSEIMNKEVEMLKKMNIAELHKLQDEKNKLANLLEQYQIFLAKNPQIVRSLPEKTFQRLTEEAQKFEEIVREDTKQTIRARRVQGIIMEAVKKAMNKKISQSLPYGRSGAVDEMKTQRVASYTPIRVKEDL